MAHSGAIVRPRRPGNRWIDPISPRSLPLWYGVLGPPLLWGAQLVLGDLIFELGCSPGVPKRHFLLLPLKGWALIMVGVALAADLVAGAVALGAWRRLRVESDGGPFERAHALALAGMLSSVVYGLLLVYGLFPTFFLHTCARSLTGP
jgi:hypothetical protein